MLSISKINVDLSDCEPNFGPYSDLRAQLVYHLPSFLQNGVEHNPESRSEFPPLKQITRQYKGDLLSPDMSRIKLPLQFQSLRESFVDVIKSWPNGSIDEDSGNESVDLETLGDSEAKDIIVKRPVSRRISRLVQLNPGSPRVDSPSGKSVPLKTRRKSAPIKEDKPAKKKKVSSSSSESEDAKPVRKNTRGRRGKVDSPNTSDECDSEDESSDESPESYEESTESEDSESDSRPKKRKTSVREVVTNKKVQNHPWYRKQALPRPETFQEYVESPKYRNGFMLKDYQVEGLNWLLINWKEERSCILADEMGLGKTFQLLAFINHLVNVFPKTPGPFLVVAPLSTLHHWENECKQFTFLNIMKIQGEERGTAMDDALRTKPHIIVCAYDTFRSEISWFRKLKWVASIFDEGHRIKTEDSLVSQAAASLDTDFKIIVTGTPVQNSLFELRNLCVQLDADHFEDEPLFEGLEDRGVAAEKSKDIEYMMQVKAMIDPFILRRDKKMIDLKIPPKREVIIEVELTNQQKGLYRAVYDKNYTFLKHKFQKNVAVAMFSTLKSICNHPYVMDRDVEPKVVAEYHNDDPTLEDDEIMIRCSSKLVLVDKILKKVLNDGEKILIFSQSIAVLNILEDYLLYRGYGYCRLDGSTSVQDRVTAMGLFNTDPKCSVFILSTKAGGQGINLTAANHVIIYDSDNNPFNDTQASARVHRIGQKKPVTIYRLVTRHTYEEVILKRAGKRLVMGSLLLEDKDYKDETPDALQLMLREGAYHIFKETDESTKNRDVELLNADIEEYLAKNATEVMNTSQVEGVEGDDSEKKSEKPSKVAYEGAYFAPEQSVAELTAEDFWEKLLPGGQHDIEYLLKQYDLGKFAGKEEDLLKEALAYRLVYDQLPLDDFKRDCKHKFWNLLYLMSIDPACSKWYDEITALNVHLESTDKRTARPKNIKGKKGSSSESDDLNDLDVKVTDIMTQKQLDKFAKKAQKKLEEDKIRKDRETVERAEKAKRKQERQEKRDKKAKAREEKAARKAEKDKDTPKKPKLSTGFVVDVEVDQDGIPTPSDIVQPDMKDPLSLKLKNMPNGNPAEAIESMWAKKFKDVFLNSRPSHRTNDSITPMMLKVHQAMGIPGSGTFNIPNGPESIRRDVSNQKDGESRMPVPEVKAPSTYDLLLKEGIKNAKYITFGPRICQDVKSLDELEVFKRDCAHWTNSGSKERQRMLQTNERFSEMIMNFLKSASPMERDRFFSDFYEFRVFWTTYQQQQPKGTNSTSSVGKVNESTMNAYSVQFIKNLKEKYEKK